MSLLSVIFPDSITKPQKRTKHRHYHARGTSFTFQLRSDAYNCLQRLADYFEIHGAIVERLGRHVWSVNHDEMILWVDTCDNKECAFKESEQ